MTQVQQNQKSNNQPAVSTTVGKPAEASPPQTIKPSPDATAGTLSGGASFDIEAYRKQQRDKITDMTDAAVGRLAESLAAGKSETLVQYLTTMSKFHRYSLSNQLLIFLQDPDASHVAGYERWKHLGRQVKRGEKGILILAPITKVVGTTTETSQEGQPVERQVRRIVNAKGVYVFDVRQTEGKALPEFATVTGDATRSLAGLEAIYDAEGIALSFVKRLPSGVKGVSKGKSVEVLAGLSDAERFSVAVHELAHELLHRGERRQETTTKVRETEAEAVAFVVCHAVGLDCSTAASDYIQLYHGTPETLEESFRHIRSASLRILSDLLPKREPPSE